MLSRRIAAGWSELPGVMAGNIIISLSLMATSTPPFISPPSESGEKLPAFSFSGNQTDGGREKSRRQDRQVEVKGVDFWRRWEGVKMYKDVARDEEVERVEMRSQTERTNGGVRGTSQVAIKRETGKGKRELLTAAIICLLPHLSSSKQGCHHLLTSTPYRHRHHLGLRTLEERHITEKLWNPKFA